LYLLNIKNAYKHSNINGLLMFLDVEI